MNIYDTYFLLAAVKEIPLSHSFFRDRYFPTSDSLDIFGTSKVLVDFSEGGTKLAPFVVPRIGGVSILRSGFETFELEPPNISLKSTLTNDDLQSRGFGESLMSGLTPADRESVFLMDDMLELDARITRREEWMAVETMLGNGCVMKHITDREDVAFEEIEARYYRGADNPSEYTSAAWTASNWRKHVTAMVKRLSARGLPATDLVVAPDVGEFIEMDPWVEKRLDNRRMEYGHIAPKELTDGTTFLGQLNFGGKMLNIIIVEETYEDDKGSTTPYLPDGSAIVTAPDCGHTIYGGVTQMEKDEKRHTHAGKRVPRYFADVKTSVSEIMLTSKPLMAPRRMSPWQVAKDVFN